MVGDIALKIINARGIVSIALIAIATRTAPLLRALRRALVCV